MYRTGLLGILAVGGFFSFAVGIVVYILTAIGLSKLAQKQNIPNAWLAWIPIAQLYIIGMIIKEIKLGTTTIPRMDLVLPLGAIAVGILSWIPAIGWLIGICYYAMVIYSLYLLYGLYVPDQALLYTILSALGLFFIFIFIIRDKDQVAAPATNADTQVEYTAQSKPEDDKDNK